MAREPSSVFNAFAGPWSGTNRLWFTPGDPPADSPCPSTARLILNGKGVVHEYEWSLEGEVHSGIAIIGHGDSGYQVAWMDTFHTNASVMFLEGEAGQAQVDVKGSYKADGKTWGWRIKYSRRESGLVVEMWNISPDGVEERAVEIA
jgi:hypothetical protein